MDALPADDDFLSSVLLEYVGFLTTAPWSLSLAL